MPLKNQKKESEELKKENIKEEAPIDYEKTQTFSLLDKNIDDFQIITEICLNKMGLIFNSSKLDKDLIIITFHDKNKPLELQKDNKIALFQEGDTLYIQLKGLLTENEANNFWNMMENESKKEPKIAEKEIEKEPTKEEIVSSIIKNINDKGYTINPTEALEFIENFQEEFKRLPKKEEIQKIVASYIKLKQEEEQKPSEIETTIIEEQELTEDFDDISITEEISEEKEEEIEISPTDALKALIQDFSFLSEQEQEYFSNLLDNYDLDTQKMIVSNISLIEEKISNIEGLDEKYISQLRKDLVLLTPEEIEEKIKDIIKEISIEEEYEGMEKKLRSLKFLTEANIVSLLKMTKKLPEERQDQVIERLKAIEKEFDDIQSDGIVLSEWEKAQFRIELVRLTEKNRKERLMELIKDKKEELIKDILFSEIPQLKYEDNKKIIKELLWLNKEEIEQRIQKLKANIQKQIEKKQELFAKSTAGSTCPECGWPVGSFTKKCPRCGRKLIDWLD
ncbi:MAG: hypothetical protein ACP6IY_02395 [Promethearchaeia archaeon]